MAHTVVFSASVQWTPPSAPTNSGQSAFTFQASYNAQNTGSHDVPSGTAPATEFPIPFGSVNKAKLLVIKNLMTTDVNVKLNGSTDLITLAPQGMMSFNNPTDPTTGTNPLTEASVIILTSPTNVEAIQYWVFGD